MTDLSFDLVFHLAGEQILPNYMGIRLCEASVHVVVVSERTAALAQRLAAVLGLGPDALMTMEVDPYDLAGIRSAFAAREAKFHGLRIGFNVTGGTKPMFAAALEFCRTYGAIAFYVDTSRRTVDFLHPDRPALPLPPLFSSVDEFVRLAGYAVGQAGKWADDPRREERIALTECCWRERLTLAQYQRGIADLNREPFEPFEITSPPTAKRPFMARLSPDWEAQVTLGGDSFAFARWPDLARYLSGGWLEEYVYLLLRPHEAAGAIRDLRIGLCPAWGAALPRNLRDAQEFDVAFTDGFGLTLIECKAGAVQQTAVQKIENLTRTFGGAMGTGIVAAGAQQAPAARARLEQSRSVITFLGEGVAALPTLMATARPGDIVTSGPRHSPAPPAESPRAAVPPGVTTAALQGTALPEKGTEVTCEVIGRRARKDGTVSWRLCIRGMGEESRGVFSGSACPQNCAVGGAYRCVVRGTVAGNMSYEWVRQNSLDGTVEPMPLQSGDQPGSIG